MSEQQASLQESAARSRASAVAQSRHHGVGRLGLSVPASTRKEYADMFEVLAEEVARAEVELAVARPAPPDWVRLAAVLAAYAPARQAIRDRDDIADQGLGYVVGALVLVFLALGAALHELVLRLIATMT